MAMEILYFSDFFSENKDYNVQREES
ncbi:MAG: hypothetical protein RL619_940, partial [Bacteroidota bacterium]